MADSPPIEYRLRPAVGWKGNRLEEDVVSCLDFCGLGSGEAATAGSRESENSADSAAASCEEAFREDLLGNMGVLPGRLDACEVCEPTRLGISMPPPVSMSGNEGGIAGALAIGPSSV